MTSRILSFIVFILLLISGCSRTNSPVELAAPPEHLSRWVDVKDDNTAPSTLQITPRVFAPNVLTTVRFGLPIAAVVSLRIYDGTGNLVARLAERVNLEPGSYEVRWDASEAGSGVYIFTLIYQGLGADLEPNTATFTDNRKLLLLK